jgi:medium-chain acyl-[acyl-carrier-protein] hydrolase
LNKLIPNYSETFIIRASEVDIEMHISASSLMALFQELAWNHATVLGIGRQFFDQEKYWVLSSFSMKILEWPRWQDKVQIETRPEGVDGLFAFRSFKLKSESKKVQVEAISKWIIVDARRKKPLRPSSHIPYLNDLADGIKAELEPEPNTENLALLSTLDVEVLRSHLDMNRHVNNTVFVSWCIDALANFPIINSPSLKIKIHFLAEAIMGEKIQLRVFSNGENGFFIIGERISDRKLIFRSNLKS